MDVLADGAVRGRAKALVVLCAMQLMIILDRTVVTVALPTIQGVRRRWPPPYASCPVSPVWASRTAQMYWAPYW